MIKTNSFPENILFMYYLIQTYFVKIWESQISFLGKRSKHIELENG